MTRERYQLERDIVDEAWTHAMWRCGNRAARPGAVHERQRFTLKRLLRNATDVDHIDEAVVLDAMNKIEEGLCELIIALQVPDGKTSNR